jgi:hypothetical protein
MHLNKVQTWKSGFQYIYGELIINNDSKATRMAIAGVWLQHQHFFMLSVS